jgi:hypothetical protein
MAQELQKQEIKLEDCRALTAMSSREIQQLCRKFGLKIEQGKILSRPLSLGSFKPY